MSNLVMMYWSCPACGNINIPGSKRDCPFCGKPRGEETKFYFKDESRETISDEEAAKISRKPDWYCAYCGALNNAKEESCTSCGSPRSEACDDYFSIRKKVEERANERYQEKRALEYPDEEIHDDDYYEQRRYSDITSHYIPREKKEVKLPWYKKIFSSDAGMTAAICGGVLALVLLLVFLLIPKTKTIDVTSHEWQKQISIEHLNTYDESSFDPPSGARIYDSQVEIERYDQVLDHYETRTETYQEYVQTGTTTRTEYRDLGNGYAEAYTVTEPTYGYETRTREVSEPVYRSVPVYGTKYYYEIDRWEHERYVTATDFGTKDYWPEFTLGDKEQEGAKTETFTIHAMKKDKEVSYTCDRDLWISIKDNTKVKVKVSMGTITEIVE